MSRPKLGCPRSLAALTRYPGGRRPCSFLGNREQYLATPSRPAGGSSASAGARSSPAGRRPPSALAEALLCGRWTSNRPRGRFPAGPRWDGAKPPPPCGSSQSWCSCRSPLRRPADQRLQDTRGRCQVRSQYLLELVPPCEELDPTRIAQSGRSPSRSTPILTRSFCVQTRASAEAFRAAAARRFRSLAVGVMVGKLAEIDHAIAADFERMPEASRIAQPAECQHPSPSQRFQRQLDVHTALTPDASPGERGEILRRHQCQRCMHDLDPYCLWRKLHYAIANCTACFRRQQIGPRQGDDMGSGQSCQRFAERAAGKTCSYPNGSRASRSTMSKSRPIRRCWKASSSTSA